MVSANYSARMDCVSGATTPIPGDSIRVHLEKILASPRFAHSERLKRFLRFSVEEALQGRVENLKEYTLALEVFDKAASHDPGADPIVRVEARRLRARLKEYYETDGLGDPIRIDMPKGAYIPIFRRVAPPARPRRSAALGIATGAILIAAAVAAWRYFREGPHELVLKRLTSDAGLTTQPAISPDGKLLAYSSDRGGDGDLEIWVQPTAGGDPLRLTHIPADDHEPDFSPDSTRIAFRSERNGGGVFIVPAQGGEVRHLAEHGRNPRFSPDGNLVAYWVGSAGGDLLPPSAGKIFLVPAAGGTPRPFQSEFPSAVNPVWSPDGSYILFEAMLDPDTATDRKVDWWTAGVAGGEAEKAGIGELLQRQGLSMLPNAGPPVWNGDSLLFTARRGDTANLWQVRFSQRTRRVAGPAQRLTFGSALEMYPNAAAGRIVFTSLSENDNLWSQPVDWREGVAIGDMQRLTEGSAHDIFPSVSADGNRIAYLSNKKGNFDIWLKDLHSRVETAVAAGGAPKRYPLISPSGSRIIYGEQAGGSFVGYLVSASGGDPAKICGGCAQALDWSPDERGILIQQQHDPSPLSVDLLKLPSRETVLFLQHPKWNLSSPRFSPDGRRVVFHAIVGPVRRQVFVAPIVAGVAATESQWIPITDGLGLDRNAVFSPDGSLLYFLSERDGFRCIWGQRLDHEFRPRGAAFAVVHLHNAKHSLGTSATGSIGLAAAPGKLIFSAAEFTGNIWILQ
jgi:Tol biopolymer transport system component